jgi:hypothetical protein
MGAAQPTQPKTFPFCRKEETAFLTIIRIGSFKKGEMLRLVSNENRGRGGGGREGGIRLALVSDRGRRCSFVI